MATTTRRQAAIATLLRGKGPRLRHTTTYTGTRSSRTRSAEEAEAAALNLRTGMPYTCPGCCQRARRHRLRSCTTFPKVKGQSHACPGLAVAVIPGPTWRKHLRHRSENYISPLASEPQKRLRKLFKQRIVHKINQKRGYFQRRGT